ncbi:MAG: radical SAM protein [Pseudomonadota bacterium]
MKILLIYPYFIEERVQTEDIGVPPIGLYFVAAVLRENGYDPEILNWHDIQKTPGRIEEVLKEKRPDVIGFSILHANRWGGIEIARTAKTLAPHVKIVFGGVGASFLWGHLLSHIPEIDFVVIGEGEYPFLDLIRAIEKGEEEEFHEIRGIAFKKKGKIVKTEEWHSIEDLDLLPIPAKYFLYNHVSSSRGCPWRCTFCGSPNFWGQKIRFRSPENFVNELELLYKNGMRFFYISDDAFTINKERVIEICRRIIEKDLKITWNAISRVDHVDEEILSWMRKAGCIQVSYGVESGSEKIRRLLNKNVKTSLIKKAFFLTRRCGLLPRAYFVYGSPGETWETIQESIDLIHEIKPLSVVFYILDLFPGTALYERIQKAFHITDDIWLNRIEGIMCFEVDPALSDELILAFGKKLRTDFYTNIHGFVDPIRLMDKKEFYELHSDFLSRLAMTFSHGDYSKIDLIKEKDKIAERLFEKSLGYYPNPRGYLGLGILRQRDGQFEQSIEILLKGLESFSDNEEINLCIGMWSRGVINLQVAQSKEYLVFAL